MIGYYVSSGLTDVAKNATYLPNLREARLEARVCSMFGKAYIMRKSLGRFYVCEAYKLSKREY